MDKIFELFKSVVYDSSSTTTKNVYFSTVDGYSLVWMDTLTEAKERSYCPGQRANILKRYEFRPVGSSALNAFADAYYHGFVTVCEEEGIDHSLITKERVQAMADNQQLGVINPFKLLGGQVYETLSTRKGLPEEKRMYKARKF